jgi:hypothetical protein
MSPCRSAVPGGGSGPAVLRAIRPWSPGTISTIAPASLMVVNSEAEAATAFGGKCPALLSPENTQAGR